MYMQDNTGHQKLAIDCIFSFIKSYRWTYLGHIKLIRMASIYMFDIRVCEFCEEFIDLEY